MNPAGPPVWREAPLRVAGTSVATFEAGNAARDAPAVVLLHGLGHWSDAAWGRLVPHLDPAARYVAFDWPGFGASEKPAAAYDLRFFRAVLDDAVVALELRRFALVGHSLGGYLAADFAGRAPDRVERLALIAPAAFARSRRHTLFALATRASRAALTRVRPTHAFVVRTFERSVRDASVLDRAMVERAYSLSQERAMRDAFAAVYAGATAAFSQRARLLGGFARYTGPVFCAWGRHDRFIPAAALRDVVAVYPNAQTLILEHSGHLPMIEEPRVLGAALTRFLTI